MVMLGSIESDQAALEALSLLAGRTPAEILGMFVEDIELLMLAELPIAREYCLLTHVERRLQPPDIERLFRVQARAAQQALADIADRLGSTLSFRTVRGVTTTLLREALAETDLMLFGAVRGALRLPGGNPQQSRKEHPKDKIALPASSCHRLSLPFVLAGPFRNALSTSPFKDSSFSMIDCTSLI